MAKYKEGEAMGCTDQSAPETYTNYQLSRVVDGLDAFEEVGLKLDVWRILPVTLRMEINYAKWTYTNRK